MPHNSRLLIKSDCTTTVAVFNKGSCKPHLNNMVTDIQVQAAQKGCIIQCLHLPGKDNARVDALSRRTSEQGDYTLNYAVWRQVCKWLTVNPVLDMFAAHHNKRCSRFWAWRPCPEAEAVDAMAQEWSRSRGEDWWCNPPWQMIWRVLHKIKEEKARLVLCVPKWESQAWWPVYQSMVKKQVTLSGPLWLDRWGDIMPAPKWKTCVAIVEP